MAGRSSFAEDGEIHDQLPQTPGSPSSRPAGTHADTEGKRPERSQYNSPPYASSSITPPPTTQVLPRPYSASPFRAGLMEPPQPVRTPTPSRSLLSSPPPTVDRPLTHPDHGLALPYESPSSAQVAKATTAELQSFVEEMKAEMGRLATALTEARTAAAHHKLQYNLLSIDTEEAAKRMAVEQEMTRREVEVLRHTEPTPRLPRLDEFASSPPAFQEPLEVRGALFELEEQVRLLQSENEMLQRRLRRAKKVILYRDGEMHTLLQERDRLRQRIKENREHFNQFRRMHGLYEGGTPQPIDSLAATPQPHPPKPRAPPLGSARTGGGQDTFAALLLAGQVLGQGDASPQPPPARARAPRTGQSGHSRGTQSLSSLPSTPSLLRPTNANDPRSIARVSTRDATEFHASSRSSRPSERERRRESRDSTISASETDPLTPTQPRKIARRAEVIHESEASQLATHMLRRSPVLTKSHGTSSADQVRRSSQMKLVGKIKKPSVGGRSDEVQGKIHRGDAVEHESSTAEHRLSKRLRTSEGIGLGIGAWKSPKA